MGTAVLEKPKVNDAKPKVNIDLSILDIKRKNIGVDIDGTLAPHDWPALFKEALNVNITDEDVWGFNFEEIFGLTIDDIYKLFVLDNWKFPKIDKNGVSIINSLYNGGCNIYVFTAKTDFCSISEVNGWLTKNNLKFNNIFCGNNIHEMPQLDYMIDDYVPKFTEAKAKVNILIDRPWNKRVVDVFNKFTRVFTWEQVYDIIEYGFYPDDNKKSGELINNLINFNSGPEPLHETTSVLAYEVGKMMESAMYYKWDIERHNSKRDADVRLGFFKSELMDAIAQCQLICESLGLSFEEMRKMGVEKALERFTGKEIKY